MAKRARVEVPPFLELEDVSYRLGRLPAGWTIHRKGVRVGGLFAVKANARVAALKEADQRLERAVFTDAVTGIPDRGEVDELWKKVRGKS